MVETGGQQKTIDCEPSSSSLNSPLNHDHDYTSRVEISEENDVKNTNEPGSSISAEIQDNSYGSSANQEPASPSLTEPYCGSSIDANLIAKDGETSDINLPTQEGDASQSDNQVGPATSGATDSLADSVSEPSSTNGVSDVIVQVKTQDNNDDDDEIDGREVKTNNTKGIEAKEGKKRRFSSKDTESEDETVIKGKSYNILLQLRVIVCKHLSFIG